MTFEMPNDYLESQVERLSKKYPSEMIFVEIGTSTGSSALRTLKGIHKSGVKRWFFTIDPYGDKPYRDQAHISISMHYDEKEFREAMFELTKHAHEKKMLYYHWRMLSSDFIKVFPQIEFWHEGKKIENPQFGFVYLDGEHTWDTVIQEFKWFYERMPSGGMIAIDDIHFLGNEEGVKKLLNDFSFKGKTEFKKIGNNYRAYFTKK